MIRITITKSKKKDLPLRNWKESKRQGRAFAKTSIKSAKSSKKLATKTYKETKTRLGLLADKLPKKSIYKKYKYF